MTEFVDIVLDGPIYIELVVNQGSVYSVNGKVGHVELTAEDVGADPDGSAAAAEEAANAYTETALLAKQDRISGKISGGSIEVDNDTGEVTVEAATYFIQGSGVLSAPEKLFDVALSSDGQVRYVGFFGNTSGQIVKIEGTEGTSAAYPNYDPEELAPIGYVLVSDGAIGDPEEPGSIEWSGIGGNPGDSSALKSFVKDQRVLTVTSSANIEINVDLYDALEITALATNTTITVTGTPSRFRPLATFIKDNGTSRTVTFHSDNFFSAGESLQTSTTVGKVTSSGFFYYPHASKFGCVGVKTEP